MVIFTQIFLRAMVIMVKLRDSVHPSKIKGRGSAAFSNTVWWENQVTNYKISESKATYR